MESEKKDAKHKEPGSNNKAHMLCTSFFQHRKYMEVISIEKNTE